MKKLIKRFLKEERGVTAIEYALIAGLIVAAIAATLKTIGTDLNTILVGITASL